MAVPPEKSMPNFRPFCTNTAKTPSAISAQEAKIARHLYFRKSMLVCRKNSISGFLYGDRVDVLAAAVHELEQRVGHEDGREHRDQQTDDQRDGEALDRAGAELQQEEGRDDRRRVRVDDRGERL